MLSFKILSGMLMSVITNLAYGAWLPDRFHPQLPPPPRSAPEARELLSRKFERSIARVEEIKAESHDPTFRFWQVANTDPAMCPDQVLFLNQVIAEAEPLILRIKSEFNRARPNVALPEISPVIPVPWHAAYPSGHATQAHLLYLVFETWYPSKAYEFERLAFRIADNREVAGVHYRSDSEAGRSLARHIFRQYIDASQFVLELETPCEH